MHTVDSREHKLNLLCGRKWPWCRDATDVGDLTVAIAISTIKSQRASACCISQRYHLPFINQGLGKPA